MLIDPSGNPSLAFTLFAAECEGDIPTPVGKRSKVLKKLRELARYTLIDETTVIDECASAGIYDTSEIEYIKSQVGVY